VCWVSLREDGRAEGKSGCGWAGLFMENGLYIDGNKREC
jgi:hypothetical protein